MTAHPDPWATTDHDPTSLTPPPVHHAAVITTAHAFALAHANIHDAAAHDGQLRRQYALAARQYADMVLLAPDATATQRECANYYRIDAEIFLANT